MEGNTKAVGLMIALAIFGSAVLVGAVLYRYQVLPNSLPNGYATLTVDPDDNGLANYLVVKSKVNVPTTGAYALNAELASSDRVVSATTGTVDLSRGSSLLSVGFRGSDISTARPDGDLTATISLSRGDFAAVNRHSVGAVSPSAFEARDSVVTLTGGAEATPADADGDGLFDSVAISVPVRVNRDAYYQVHAAVEGGLQGPAWNNRPHAGFTAYDPRFLTAGSYVVSASLSGSDIYLAGVRGGIPLSVEVFTTPGGHYCPGYGDSLSALPPEDGGALGLQSPSVMPDRPQVLGTTAAVRLEGVDFSDFDAPEFPADFTGTVVDALDDFDQDGAADALRVTATIAVNRPGVYDVSGTLYARGTQPLAQVQGTRSTVHVGGVVVSTAWVRERLDRDATRVSLAFPGAEILASGVPGPYEVKLRLVPASVYVDPVIVHVTADYRLDQFEAWGAKPATVSALSADLASGQITATVANGGELLVRVIHENGVVAFESNGLDGAWVSGATAYAYREAIPGEYAVAAYLLVDGRPVDYRELVVRA